MRYCRIKSQGEYGKERMFFGMADIFREGKEDLSSACWLSNRKEADGTADCIKTGL